MIGASMITKRERVAYRKAIKDIDDFIDSVSDELSGKQPLPFEVKAALVRMSNTTDLMGQYTMLQKLQEDLNAQYDEHLKYAAQFRLSPFCEYIARDEVPAPHHEFMIERLEAISNGDLLRLLISMPPGHAKSTYSSHRFPAWYLGRNPHHKWLQAAHTMDFARNRLGKPVRSIISSDKYRALFPEVFLSQDSSAADFFEFANHPGYYKAVGVGVGVAGYRADIQAVDDPFKSREDAESKTIRNKVFDWYSADFTTRMARKEMPQFVVATRWHPDDLCGRLEDLTHNKRGMPFEIINLPAIALDNDPMGRERGDPLWPSQFDLEILMELKSKLPGRDWNSLYMGDPVDEEGGVLNRENVYRYKTVPADEMRGDTILKKVVRRIILSVDCAEKATQRSDFTAVTVWIETVDKKHYLVHAAHARLEFPAMVRYIDHIAETWGVSAILCEDHGAGTQYIQLREKSHGPAPVIAIQTLQKSKEFRFDGVSPMFEAKEVLLPEKGTDWVADVEAELYAFPHGRNDDYVDSTSQYLTWARDQNVRRGVRKLRGRET
jgi:predicted phage terminase large subunit-like protein